MTSETLILIKFSTSYTYFEIVQVLAKPMTIIIKYMDDLLAICLLFLFNLTSFVLLTFSQTRVTSVKITSEIKIYICIYTNYDIPIICVDLEYLSFYLYALAKTYASSAGQPHSAYIFFDSV